MISFIRLTSHISGPSANKSACRLILCTFNPNQLSSCKFLPLTTKMRSKLALNFPELVF